LVSARIGEPRSAAAFEVECAPISGALRERMNFPKIAAVYQEGA
jgi:hypothetical protein